MLQDPDLLALQDVRMKVEKAYAAWLEYRNFSQEQIDAIVEHVGAAARQHAQRLAELAVEETGYGNATDKLAKNLLAADLLVRTLRGQRLVGLRSEDKDKRIVEIGVPMGVIAAILPTTNPTSTAIYKTIISLKAGNGIVLSPHPRARRCTCETAAMLAHAAEQAGAPAGLVQCLGSPTLESTNELMRHRKTAAILSTGGSGIVRAAYSSGKPAFGVGPGNVPVVIDVSAPLGDAVGKVLAGKSFDYGTLCSSEQAIIAEASLREPILAELRNRNAYLCNEQQKQALAKLLLLPPKWSVNPECVGQPATKIAKMAGFEVPPSTNVLAVEVEGVGREHPLSAEKLSPVLSLFFVKNWAACLDTAESILRFGGLGHTCGIHATDEVRIREYALRMPSMRVLCNSSTPHGSVGITTNLSPAMTLGCGAVAGNITGDNVGAHHLVNIKRLAYEVRKPEEAFAAKTAGPVPTKHEIVAAVERYLNKSGVQPVAEPQRPAADVVDRFLNARRAGAPPPPSAPAAACPCPLPETAPAPPPPLPAPVKVVDFVSENDVRVAVHKSEKIFIGPKTIVTPAARDLAAQHDTLVLAQRS